MFFITNLYHFSYAIFNCQGSIYFFTDKCGQIGGSGYHVATKKKPSSANAENLIVIAAKKRNFDSPE